MKKIIKLVPALLIAGVLLLNPIGKQQPTKEATGQPVPYMQVDPGTGVG